MDRRIGGRVGSEREPMNWLAAGHLRGDRPLPSVQSYGAGRAPRAWVDQLWCSTRLPTRSTWSR